jgi:iron(III) transport system permease protein
MSVDNAPRTDTALAGELLTGRRRTPWLRTDVTHYALWALAMLVIVGPLVPVLIASLWTTPLYESGGHLTFANYERLFTDPQWWAAVRNSLLFAATTTVGAVVGGTMVAILLTRTDLPGKRLVTVLLLIPIALPGLVLILGWNTFWAPSGYGSSWLESNLGIGVPFNLYGITGMALVCISVTAPIVFFFVRGVLVNIDSALEDAARSSGASPLRALMSVTVPMLRPAILNSGMLVFALALEVLGIALILGAPSNTDLIGSYLYAQWFEKMPADQGLVSAGAVCLLLVVSVLLLVRNRLAGDGQRFVYVTGEPRSGVVVRLGPAKWIITVALVGLLLLGVVGPLASVTLSAFTSVLTPFINPFTVLTTANFSAVLGNPLFTQSIVNSLLIATIGGAVTTVLVAVLSIVAHRSTFRLRGSLQQAMLWPRTVPGLVTGMAFFWAFAVLSPSGSLRDTLIPMAIAFAVRNLALAYSAFYPALAAIGQDMERAARTSGATWWRAATSIVLRLVVPAMAASFVLLFVALLNEYDPAVFLVTPDTPVMGLTMLQISLTGVGGPVAAFGVIQMVLTLLVLGLGRLALGVRARV